MSRVYPLLVAGLIVMALTAAACGSSSSSGSTTTTAPTSPTTLSTAPATTSGGGAGDTGFCGSAKKDLKDLQAEDSSLLAGGVTPDAIKTEFSNLRSAYAHALSQAPAEIKPDLAVISRFIGKLNTVLASDNYNIRAAAPQLESLANSTQLKQAGAHLKAWAVANCGA
jgi:hypothetical protein